MPPEQEEQMMLILFGTHPNERVQPVAEPAELSEVSHLTRGVRVDESLRKYIVALIQATRSAGDLALGASPRGSLSLYRSAQARAGLCRRRGGGHLMPD